MFEAGVFCTVLEYSAEPWYQTVKLGRTAIIGCFSEMPIVRWYKKEEKKGKLADNVKYLPPANYIVHRHTLLFLVVKEENYGTYICQYQDHRNKYTYFISRSTLARDGKFNYLAVLQLLVHRQELH